jgi:predicted dehydrogenase
MKIGIVGCGLIGDRRARVAQAAGDEILMAADLVVERARTTASAVGAEWTGDWTEVTNHPAIDAVVVATINKSLLPVTLSALKSGKHVLCEKPLGRNAAEAGEMAQAAKFHRRILGVGFNHRYHPAIWRAHELFEEGSIGPIMYLRATYGHGGRPGYDQEWRGDPELAGGGELLDQGVHIIDLCRWFMGDFSQISGMLGTYFWQVGPLEDNGFALLRTAAGQVAMLHTSWTQWKNLFRFEVFGRDGFLLVEGLGGSYGIERLTLGRRRPESGPPEITVWEYPGPDESWKAQWAEFTAAVREKREPLGSGQDGYQAARVIDAIYEAYRTGQILELK